VLARWTGNAPVLTKIAAQRDGAIAKRLHALFELVRRPVADHLLRVPAYAKNGNVV